MKKVLITILVSVLSLSIVPVKPALAQMDMMMDFDAQEATEEIEESHTESLEVVLQEILEKQNVNIIQELNCASVGDRDFERLGDSVMETQHPGESHEVMDRMMGGEGSESLKQMHINMGRAYLNCEDEDNYYGTTGFRNGMYNDKETMFPMMMGYRSGVRGGVFGILSSLILFSLNAFLLAGAYYFVKKATSVGKKTTRKGEKPHE